VFLERFDLRSWIQNLTVEGGFLDGLDLSFKEGLNVIIGGRGTGKTSIIELIRYCLDVKNYTESSQLRSREHALAILGDGRVTLTLNDRDTPIVISRSSREPEKAVRLRNRPSIFSQTDIETIGLSSQGRIKMIDDFVDQEFREEDENQLLAQVRSLTHELQEVVRERETLDTQVRELPELKERLSVIEKDQATASQSSEVLAAKNNELKQLSSRSSLLQVEVQTYNRTMEALLAFLTRLEGIIRSFPELEINVQKSVEDRDVSPAQTIREEWERARRALGQSRESLIKANRVAGVQRSSLAAALEPLDAKSRMLRKETEQIQAGAGALARTIALTKGQIAELTALDSIRQQKNAQIQKLQADRRAALDALDALRARRYERRQKVAAYLTTALGPRIRVDCVHMANYESYVSQITQALRGSGLRYSELAQQISQRMSPRELGEAIEAGDFEALANLRISSERLSRVIDSVQEFGTEGLLTCEVEDEVRLQLLDGTSYKGIDMLSTGQRCTVILPIILQHRERVLIVDQPEDHLDNAFVVDTLVRSILNRADAGQTILSTHNANIPVLGDSERVVVMGSDGRTAFISAEGPLHNRRIVEAITTLMEGGREAFDRRAQFYGEFYGH
jgi:predicted ATP-dependent endonuclease of OLD family